MERIQGRIPTQVDVIRAVGGLTLPLRCTIVNGLALGSCSYADFWKDVVQDICGFNASNCPPELTDWGIDCNCPFNIPAQTIDESSSFHIPDLNYEMMCPFFFIPTLFGGISTANGDFDVKISINNSANQHVACFRFLFTILRAYN